MRYGKQNETKTIDTNGSTIRTEKNIVDFKTNKPIRKRYEYREKVIDKKGEMTEYLKFSDSLTPKMLDPAFKIEYTQHGKDNGYYIVAKCYTELIYE